MARLLYTCLRYLGTIPGGTRRASGRREDADEEASEEAGEGDEGPEANEVRRGRENSEPLAPANNPCYYIENVIDRKFMKTIFVRRIIRQPNFFQMQIICSFFSIRLIVFFILHYLW